MDEGKIQQYISKGFIRIAVIFEVVGNPKEHVEKTLKAYVEKLKEENLPVLNEAFDEAKHIEENNLYSAVAELEMLIPNMEKLSWLCINFTPASVEVIQPASVDFKQQEITHWANDMLSRIHEIGMHAKQVTSQHESMIRNFNAMTRNAILLALREPQDIASVSRKIGLPDEHTIKFLDALIKEKKVMKDKNHYRLLQ